MNATTASFLGLRRRQRAQDLLREALRRAPASQCARASQSAIRIAAIASVHVNCTVQSRVTLIHCIAHQLLVNLVARAVLAMFAPPGQGGVGPSVRIGRRKWSGHTWLARDGGASDIATGAALRVTLVYVRRLPA